MTISSGFISRGYRCENCALRSRFSSRRCVGYGPRTPSLPSNDFPISLAPCATPTSSENVSRHLARIFPATTLPRLPASKHRSRCRATSRTHCFVLRCARAGISHFSIRCSPPCAMVRHFELRIARCGRARVRRRFVKRLARLQDRLGAIHDIAVARDTLRAHADTDRFVTGELVGFDTARGVELQNEWNAVWNDAAHHNYRFGVSIRRTWFAVSRSPPDSRSSMGSVRYGFFWRRVRFVRAGRSDCSLRSEAVFRINALRRLQVDRPQTQRRGSSLWTECKSRLTATRTDRYR